MMIKGFNGQYKFLSNFYPSEIEFEGIKYPTAEHAYQAAKTEEPLLREWIAEQSTPGNAKKQGRLFLLRTDWDEVKIPIMQSILRKKFGSHSDLALKLLKTGEKVLIETNYWHDNFWGDCVCGRHNTREGENHLGKLLMEQRELIREAVNDGVVF